MTFLGLPNLSDGRSCRQCGCADRRACVSPTTGPCWWVEPDLCSGCSGAQPDAVPPSRQQYVCVGVDLAGGPDFSAEYEVEHHPDGSRTITTVRTWHHEIEGEVVR
jgi:hypothetical protein